MTSIIITFFIVISGIIGGIYHNEVVHEFNNIYNSFSGKKITNSISSNTIDGLDIKGEKNLIYNDKNKDKLNLYHLLYVSNGLLNNGNKLLKDGFSLNSDLYEAIKNINDLGEGLTKIEKTQLTNILSKYKENIELQKEFLKSEMSKRNCIEKYYNGFNKNIFIKSGNIKTVKKNIVKPSVITKTTSTKTTSTKTTSTKTTPTKTTPTKTSSNTF